MDSLGKVAQKGNEHAIQALQGLLECDMADVREAAIEILGRVAVGDKNVCSKLKSRLEDMLGEFPRYVSVAILEALCAIWDGAPEYVSEKAGAVLAACAELSALASLQFQFRGLQFESPR